MASKRRNITPFLRQREDKTSPLSARESWPSDSSFPKIPPQKTSMVSQQWFQPSAVTVLDGLVRENLSWFRFIATVSVGVEITVHNATVTWVLPDNECESWPQRNPLMMAKSRDVLGLR
ncbi:hypothetical protein AAG570_005058 [Ranatra chinensis]|uniref:Uncharacterized protein n=1 Tax=Ranatra chinensis TaxID=642074 RepID=A0ABD0XZD9_9HEMI